jgi:hypothetical protein
MSYNKLIENLAKSVESKFGEISSRYNFDKGDEFEIALCELFHSILPSKYGICRGFIVTETDSFAGDDIIIYDKDRFPTIRLLESGKFDKKHEIPVEAVYAYIEAKHTIVIDGKDSNLAKAIEQVSTFKKLPREKRPLVSLDHYTKITGNFSTEGRQYWPDHYNPSYGAIISRNIKFSNGQPASFTDFVTFIKTLVLTKGSLSADLIVAGKDTLFIPALPIKEGEITIESPFVHDRYILHPFETLDYAFSIGIVNILYALDNIKLDKMPYLKIIGNAVKAKKSNK